MRLCVRACVRACVRRACVCACVCVRNISVKVRFAFYKEMYIYHWPVQISDILRKWVICDHYTISRAVFVFTPNFDTN